MERILKSLAVGLLLTTAQFVWVPPASAQTETNAEAANSEVDPASLLTQAELENLVAPVALYPDTLLIQVLVAATYPLEIIKADKFVKDNADLDPQAMEEAVNAKQYDESVAVLATAFPDVLSDMAANLDWTDSIGTAMLAQNEELLAAVQTMRDQAINAGALISGEEQTVSVDEGEVVIQPTDPQVVYVPQYNTETVYVENNSNDGVTNALLIFGTAILINEIFDNNNSWHGYWGCRNCAGWGGRPIYSNPRVNIGNGGNVVIGGDVNIGGGRDRGPNGSWQPSDRRQNEARAKISNKRGPDGATTMATRRNDARGDSMRSQLSSRTGAADLTRDKGARANVNRPAARAGGANSDAISRTKRTPTAANVRAKAPARAPAAKPAARKPAARAPAKRQSSAIKQRAPARQSRAASGRGRSSGGGGRSRGRR